LQPLAASIAATQCGRESFVARLDGKTMVKKVCELLRRGVISAIAPMRKESPRARPDPSAEISIYRGIIRIFALGYKRKEMDPIKNPFSPGAGSPPPELVGRDPVLEQARILLGRIKRKRSEKSLLLTGLRAVRTTVSMVARRRAAWALSPEGA
jgi:hypothetical protein